MSFFEQQVNSLVIDAPTNMEEFDSATKSSIVKEKEANRVVVISFFSAVAHAGEGFRQPTLRTILLLVVSAWMESQFSAEQAPRMKLVHLD
jgi:hypothetical protein